MAGTDGGWSNWLPAADVQVLAGVRVAAAVALADAGTAAEDEVGVGEPGSAAPCQTAAYDTACADVGEGVLGST